VLPRVGAAIFLFSAAQEHGRDFYTLLRWFVFSAAGLTSVIAFQRRKFAWCWLFAAVMVLFNPFAQIRLDRDTWHILDVATAALFLVSLLIVFEIRSRAKTAG
jgi:hypothetical protein